MVFGQGCVFMIMLRHERSGGGGGRGGQNRGALPRRGRMLHAARLLFNHPLPHKPPTPPPHLQTLLHTLMVVDRSIIHRGPSQHQHPPPPLLSPFPPPPPPKTLTTNTQGTKSSKRKKQAKLKRVVSSLKKAARREAAAGNEGFAALHLLHDPQVSVLCVCVVLGGGATKCFGGEKTTKKTADSSGVCRAAPARPTGVCVSCVCGGGVGGRRGKRGGGRGA